MIKNCYTSFLMILIALLISNCDDQQLTPQKNTSESITPVSSVNARATDERILISTVDYAAEVNEAFGLTPRVNQAPLTIASIFTLGNAMQPGNTSTVTKLVSHQKFEFTGTDQQGTRRPQGVANYGNYIINSWYFTSTSTWHENLKFTIADRSLGKYFNVVPVRFHSSGPNQFGKIQSHAGGLTVISHYLYVTDNETNSILVFDLDKIYKIDKPNDPNINSTANFVYEYTYMIPQVGHINFQTLSGAKTSYMSFTQMPVQSQSVPPPVQDYFVIGNFTETSSTKSMIWLLPVVYPQNSFPTIQTNASEQYPQIEPRFPNLNGVPGSSVSRIQGAVVKDNNLILSRSWQDDTRQLMVINYVDILADTPVILQYFNGSSASNPHNHETKNWWTGCEDLELYNGRVYTVTEWDDDNRSIYSALYSDIIGLM